MKTKLEKSNWLREKPVCNKCFEIATFLIRIPFNVETGVRAIGYCRKCNKIIIQNEYEGSHNRN